MILNIDPRKTDIMIESNVHNVRFKFDGYEIFVNLILHGCALLNS